MYKYTIILQHTQYIITFSCRTNTYTLPPS